MIGKLFTYRKFLLTASWLTWTLFSLMPIAVGAFNKAIFDRLDPAGNTETRLWVLFLGLAVTTVSMSGLVVLWFWTHSTFEPTIEALTRTNLHRWIVAKAGRKGAPRAPVTMVGHVRDDVPEYVSLVNEWYRLAAEAVFVVVALYIMIRIDAVVTLVTFVPLAGVVVGTHWMRTRLPRLWAEAREATTDATNFIASSFGAAQAIKVLGAEDLTVRRFRELNDRRGRSAVKSKATEARIEAITEAAVASGHGLILLVSASAMLAGRFTVGDFVLFTLYLDWLLEFPRRVGRLLSQMKTTDRSRMRLQDAMEDSSVERLVDHVPLSLTGRMSDVAQPDDIGSQSLRTLSIDQVSYRHANGGDQLGTGVEGISLRLDRGTLTVVTGEIGSGKSTLLRLVLGLITPDAGEIRWNGEVVDDIAAFMVPPRAAYTPQLPRLFSEELGETIRLGLQVDDAAMRDVLDVVELSDDVDAMDDGIRTEVGARGVRLSGGQVQRASAARMLVRPAELYVIDDLSSALDGKTARRIWAALDRARAAGTTFLVASHTPNVLRLADRIVVVQGGRVIDAGTLEELEGRSPVIRRIMGRQPDRKQQT